jgi:hypothetical protein
MARKPRERKSDIESDELANGSPESSVFVGKDCSFTESIKWAFKKHRTAGVRAKDAPSEEAWAFLETFRECDAAEVLRFMDKLVPKQVPDDGKKNTADDFDGKDLYDILGDMVREGL